MINLGIIMGKRGCGILSKVIWNADLIGARVTLAFAEFFWAVLLLWPGDTFSRAPYAQMAQLMNEESWGMLFLLSSIIQISLVLKNKMHTTGAWFFAAWNFVLWGYTVVSMLMSISPPPAAVGGDIALTISAFWIWLRPIIVSDNTPVINNTLTDKKI